MDGVHKSVAVLGTQLQMDRARPRVAKDIDRLSVVVFVGAPMVPARASKGAQGSQIEPARVGLIFCAGGVGLIICFAPKRSNASPGPLPPWVRVCCLVGCLCWAVASARHRNWKSRSIPNRLFNKAFVPGLTGTQGKKMIA